jgi:AmmeMemoRadiSam system protein B
MDCRKPAVAGSFYPGSGKECLAEIKGCLSSGRGGVKISEPILGGIVPHAGWVFSGDLAGMVFSAIEQANGGVDTFVIFGAVHRYFGRYGSVYESGSWETPLGEIAIDEELAGEIAKIDCIAADKASHADEHSIEVQVPFVQYFFPRAKIVPVMVPPMADAAYLGERVGEVIAGLGDKKVVCIASTDLTHYGPRYSFTPQGVGKKGIDWAKDVNDAKFIELALSMEAQELFETAMECENSCGPGAAVALVSAMKVLGREKGELLAHTNSYEVMVEKFGEESDESVGYAAIVY